MGFDKIFDDNLGLFFTESKEMLTEMESSLLALEKNMRDEESINALFRAVHTIKGTSSMFSLNEIESFTHIVENILDKVRNHTIELNTELIDILLKSRDIILGMVTIYESNPAAALAEELVSRKNKITGILKKYSETSVDSASVEKTEEIAEKSYELAAEEPDPEDPAGNNYWHISLRFKEGLFNSGMDPVPFINYMEKHGKILNLITIYENLPQFSKIDPEKCYLGFEIDYDTNFDKKRIDEALEFIREECDYRILPPKTLITEHMNHINNLPEEPMRIGEILKEGGTLTDNELKLALDIQKTITSSGETHEGKALIGEILVKEKMVHKAVVDAAIDKQQENEKTAERKNKTIRIDAQKLDELINVVGELVINGAAMKQITEHIGNNLLTQTVLNMSRLIEDVRDRMMNIRMVQIGETFKRFERTVRDMSRENGKEIDLLISGSDAELDKTLIEKINDPLMHLVRNSIDHGIELPDERIRIGKSARGKIMLNAYHESGSIIIEVRDDGKGLDRDKILEKAVAVGLVQSGAELSDSDVFQFIFEPGFSTAEKVTTISGRGVGMDVVRRNIEAMRGFVSLESAKGAGTVTRIQLPLTLAIIDGFMISVGDLFYVLPLDMVIEGLEVKHADITSHSGGNYFNLRGEVLPYLRLREFFDQDNNPLETENIIVVEHARKRIGLVADRLIGEFQTVIKPMGKLFSSLNWISGATILGTGEVAIILDIPKLIQNVKR